MRKIIIGLDPKGYEHPLDRQALEALSPVSFWKSRGGSSINTKSRRYCAFNTP